MKTDKSWRKLLMAAALMALLLATACAGTNELQSADGQALVEQGNAYMTCLKDSDLGCAYALMSPFAQRLEDMAARLAEGVVDLDTVLKYNGREKLDTGKVGIKVQYRPCASVTPTSSKLKLCKRF